MLSALFLLLTAKSQKVANYVTNGSFEKYYSCPATVYPLNLAKGWSGIDSTTNSGGYLSVCNNHVPLNANTFQYPKTGKAHIISTYYNYQGIIGYQKNRLKANLKSGKIYCVKFHVNICNTSPRGIDGFGIFFGDHNIDTIDYFSSPLAYLNPQVNSFGTVITDTLNWVPVTGTFVATGHEKYLLLGNFLDDNTVATASINTPFYPQKWTDALIDDVSCIEVGIDAYAGRDTVITPGDSVFIGREPDFAIDSGCVWFKLPGITPIDTISGMWVKPTETSTYVVRQHIECGSIKWDTVVVHLNPVGIERLNLLNNLIKLYPVPAKDFIELRYENLLESNSFKKVRILNMLGDLMVEEEIVFLDGKAIMSTEILNEGAYFLEMQNLNNETVTKKLLIAK